MFKVKYKQSNGDEKISVCDSKEYSIEKMSSFDEKKKFGNL